MLGRGRADRAVHRTKSDRDVRLTARHVAQFGGLVTDLIPTAIEKTGELNLHDRAHAGHGCPYACTRIPSLGNRRIANTRWPELVGQPTGRAESADPYV